MGGFTWQIGVWSADRERLETVDALVDTGSSYPVFPRPMLERLKVVPRFLLPFELADGTVIQRDVGLAMLVINDSESSMRVIFGDDDAESLIGANALQEFLLMVDPVEERLVPRTGRMKSLGKGQQGESFYCSIEVGDLNGDNCETVEVLASNRPGFLHLPQMLLYRLGISPTRMLKFKTPDGNIVELGVADVRVRLDDRSAPTPVVFDEDDAPARLGHVTLAGLGLKVDPAENRLVDELPLMKPPGWYEKQRLLKEWVERNWPEHKAPHGPNSNRSPAKENKHG